MSKPRAREPRYKRRSRRALPRLAVACLAALALARVHAGPVHAVLLTTLVVALVLGVHELLGKPVPILRWSFLRLGLGAKRLETEWQVGDGREEDVARHVLATTRAGDLDGVIDAIDSYAYDEKFLINVGDEKGALLDEAVRGARPMRALELGAYVGYSALRIARALPPGGHLWSIEWSAANAAIARRVVAHAGVGDRVTILHGSLGDAGTTMAALAATHGFLPGNLDFVFIDHDKNLYVADLERILAAGWLHAGSIIVADNVRIPGAPEYRAFIEAGEGTRWTTRAHETHTEYQTLLHDVVLETTMLDGSREA